MTYIIKVMKEKPVVHWRMLEPLRVVNGSVVSGQFSTTPKLIPTALCTPQLQTHTDLDSQELP